MSYPALEILWDSPSLGRIRLFLGTRRLALVGGGGRAVTLPPLLQGRNERNKPFLQILLSACSDLTSEVLSLRALAQVATRVPVCVLDLLPKALRPDTWAGTALVRSQQTTSGSGLGVGAVGI